MEARRAATTCGLRQPHGEAGPPNNPESKIKRQWVIEVYNITPQDSDCGLEACKRICLTSWFCLVLSPVPATINRKPSVRTKA